MKNQALPAYPVRLFLALAVFGASLVSCAGTQPSAGVPMDPAAGFRGIGWGASLDQLDDMKTVRRVGDRLIYAERVNEDLRFGEIALESLQYEFNDGMLTGVVIEYNELFNYAALVKELSGRFGPPSVENKQMNMYFWKTGDINWLLRYYRFSDKGDLKIRKGD